MSQTGHDAPIQKTRSFKDSVATIAVDVKVVALPVTVRDKHGAIVKDLTKDDFTLQEDGRPQAIKYFSLDSNLAVDAGIAGRYEYEPAGGFGSGAQREPQFSRSDADAGKRQGFSAPLRS